MLQAFVQKSKADENSAASEKPGKEGEDEKVTPPTNIAGSYLMCEEQEQLGEIDKNSTIACGLYQQPAHVLVEIGRLDQWQLKGTSAVLSELVPGSASRVVMSFHAADDKALREAVRSATLLLRNNAGQLLGGSIAELLPADSRLSTASADKSPNTQLVWSEGFEGTQLTNVDFRYYTQSPGVDFSSSILFNWTHPKGNINGCGSPTLEVLRFATQGGTVADPIGPAEGNQFIDMDSICIPNGTPQVGPSNLTVTKDLDLIPGQVYRVTFKVRQQPMRAGSVVGMQHLGLRVNGKVVTDLRSFSSSWQEISFDWVAGTISHRLEWFDSAGAPDDSIGVLLDDLRLQALKY